MSRAADAVLGALLSLVIILGALVAWLGTSSEMLLRLLVPGSVVAVVALVVLAAAALGPYLQRRRFRPARRPRHRAEPVRRQRGGAPA